MSFHNKRWMCITLILCAGYVLAGMASVIAQDAPRPEAAGFRVDAPFYALRGSYWVGIIDLPITFDYPDGTSRDSRVTIWYPALNPDGALLPFTYPTEERIAAYGGPLWFPRASKAFLDAGIDASGGPYPLVVYSHGGWGYRWFQTEYTEHLASHGFVVVSTDHEDAPATLGQMTGHYELSRQWDVSALIDYAAEITSSGGLLQGMVDLDKVAVTGYSAGGFTTLLAGGAGRSAAAKAEWCMQDETKMSWIGPLLCTDSSTREAEWAQLTGMEASADGIWPDVGDQRVKAVVSLDGGAFDFGPEGLRTLRVPGLLFFARGAPNAMPYELDTLYPSMEGKQESIAIFEAADHALFMPECVEGMFMRETAEACAEPVWDKKRANDLVHHLATAFLLDALNEDQEAHAALLAENASFPGVTYTTTLQ